MVTLPFSGEGSLREIFQKTYLLPSIEWLAGIHHQSQAQTLGTLFDCPWQVGYSMIAFLECREIFAGQQRFQEGLETRFHDSIGYLIDSALTDGDTCNWDGTLWDTAVVTRALTMYYVAFASASIAPRVVETIRKSLKWMFQEIRSWTLEKYLCTGDLAQALRTLVLIDKLPDELRLNLASTSELSKTEIDQITRQVISEAEEVRITSLEATDQTTVKWSDRFATSTVLLSLADVYMNYSDLEETRKKIAEVVRKALRGTEAEQDEGKWGLEGVTAYTLSAYLRSMCIWEGNVKPQSYIVFKALRRLCDPSQRYNDGSIMHNIEFTLYFALALIDTLRFWKLPESLLDSSALAVYDYIVWETPSNTSSERSTRLNLQAVANSQKDRILYLKQKLSAEYAIAMKWKRLFAIVSWTVVGVAVAFITDTLTLTPWRFDAIPVVAIEVTDWKVIFALSSLWITIGVGIYRAWLSGSDIPEMPSGGADQNMKPLADQF